MILNKYNRWAFIADVHLNYKKPQKFTVFKKFSNYLNDKIDCLIIIGDLFDFWLEHKNVKLSEYYSEFKECLQNLNYDIYFIPGNRDFDIGEDFKQLTGFKIIDEEFFLLTLDNKKIIITHGDLLCRHDIRYQLFRKFIRNHYVKSIIKFFPTFFVLKFISLIENISKVEKTIKDRFVQDYNYNYIEALLKKYNADYLVAGHLHEFFIKNYKKKTIISCGTMTLDKAEYIFYENGNFRKEKWRVN
jgi:UDP-2,3-diacylglucosamine hydrolase